MLRRYTLNDTVADLFNSYYGAWFKNPSAMSNKSKTSNDKKELKKYEKLSDSVANVLAEYHISSVGADIKFYDTNIGMLELQIVHKDGSRRTISFNADGKIMKEEIHLLSPEPERF